jgi:hypothetical protein
LEKFALSVHPDKTRLTEFGRHAADNREKRGAGKPETFNFLGFTHICGRSRAGYFQIKRKPRRDRMRAKLKALKGELRWRMHVPIPEQGRWLAQVVRGYFAYHAVPSNAQRLAAFRYHVTILWHRTLRRRSQKDWTKWERISRLVATYLPPVRILHPWPNDRFAVKHPGWGPGARIAPAGICAGGRPVTGVPTAIFGARGSLIPDYVLGCAAIVPGCRSNLVSQHTFGSRRSILTPPARRLPVVSTECSSKRIQ